MRSASMKIVAWREMCAISQPVEVGKLKQNIIFNTPPENTPNANANKIKINKNKGYQLCFFTMALSNNYVRAANIKIMMA